MTSEPQLWKALWKHPRTKYEHRVTTIVLPINVRNIHWYLATQRLTQTAITLDIDNNLETRSQIAEENLKRIGKRYQQKICATLLLSRTPSPHHRKKQHLLMIIRNIINGQQPKQTRSTTVMNRKTKTDPDN